MKCVPFKSKLSRIYRENFLVSLKPVLFRSSGLSEWYSHFYINNKWTAFFNLSTTQSTLQNKSAFTHFHTYSHINGRWPLYTVLITRNSYTHFHKTEIRPLTVSVQGLAQWQFDMWTGGVRDQIADLWISRRPSPGWGRPAHFPTAVIKVASMRAEELTCEKNDKTEEV